MAAADGVVSISRVERVMRCGYGEAARALDELHAAGVIGDYDAQDFRPYLGGAKKAIAECFEILKTKPEPARGWWAALDADRRAAVMRAEVVPFCHAGKAWDSLPDSARAKLTAQHDKRRKTWVLLNAEFSGRVQS